MFVKKSVATEYFQATCEDQDLGIKAKFGMAGRLVVTSVDKGFGIRAGIRAADEIVAIGDGRGGATLVTGEDQKQEVFGKIRSVRPLDMLIKMRRDVQRSNRGNVVYTKELGALPDACSSGGGFSRIGSGEPEMAEMRGQRGRQKESDFRSMTNVEAERREGPTLTGAG